MSQVYSTYTGTKPVEQLASGDGQEWLSCEVCSLTFKNQQHYSIHCGGTFHANRVAASLRTQQTSTKTGSQEDPQAAFGSSNNPSYWTGMQQAFSYAPVPQHNPPSQKPANRSQSGQGQLNTSAEAYQGHAEYVSYPVGKQAKQPSDSKTTGSYEALYGMPGFGWSDMQPDPSKFDYQSQQYPATAQLPEFQQLKVSSASKPALHDAWKNYQPQPERGGGVQAAKDFGSQKALDYGYSTQEVASYSSQKSDVPSWMKIIEPVVQKTTESYKSSNKTALYGSRDAFPSNASSTRSTEREDAWKKSASNYETDVRGPIRQTKDGSYGKTEQAVRTKTRWDTDDSLSRDGKQRGGSDVDRQNTGGRHRQEDRDSLGRGGYDSKERSNSKNSDDSYRKRESSRWEDARERDSSNRKPQLDVRDGSKRHDDSAYKDTSLYGAKRTTDKREIGSNAEVGKGGREDSRGWDSSYAGQASSVGYTNRGDVSSFSSKAGRNENVQQLRDQSVVNKASGKPDIQQFGQTESWDAYGQGWQQAAAPDAASSWKPGAATTLDKKAGYDEQRITSWGGETVQGKTDASLMQPESHGMWDAAYVSSAASAGNSWSAAPGYASAGFSSKVGQNEKTLAQGRADKGSWNQMETEKNSFGHFQGGNTWPIANSGVGSDARRSSGIAGEQEWRSVNDVLSTFKHASSKVPGQKPSTDVGSSAYGDLNQEHSNYATRPSPAVKSGQRTSDPQGGYDWSWTHGAEDKQPEFGEYNEQDYATPTDPYHQGVSEWGGSYSAGRGAFPQQPGLRDASRVGQKVAPAANQWTGWPNTEQRADVRGSGSFAKDQQTNQTGSLGRGQTGFHEVKSVGRGVGYGRSQVKEIEKPVGLSRSGDRTEKQDWAKPFNHGTQSALRKAPDVSSSTAENAGWFGAQEVTGATSAGRGGGRGGRGVVGNKPTPQPGETSGWRQGFQEQSNPSVGAGRGGLIRGSESSLAGQKNSWGFGGAGVKPTASSTKGFEKGQEGKPSSNLQEKMRQLSEQAFTMDWNERGKDWQESGKSGQTSVATPGQRNSSGGAPGQRNLPGSAPGQRNSSGSLGGSATSQRNQSIGAPGQRNASGASPNQSNSSVVAAAGQRANQTRSSVPSLLNLNVAPTSKSQKTAGIEDKHSRDAANSVQKSSGTMQPPSSSAFGVKKPEQSPTPTKISGSATAPQPVSAASKQEFVAPSAAKNVSSNLNKTPSQQSVKVQPPSTSVPAQKSVAPKSHLLSTPSTQPQNQNKPNTSVQAAIKKPTTVTVSGGQGQSNFDRLDPASARKTGSTGDNKQKVTALSSSTSSLSSSVVSSQASVTAKQTAISNVAPSKELAAANITHSASKLDSKVTPAAAAAAETRTGLKSSDSQLRSNVPPVTSSSSAAQPAITAKPAAAALASSTANTARLDPSKKPVAQRNVTVTPARDKKKEDADNDDECDPALSEALGQFFSEDGPSETAKSAVPAKKTAAGSTKFVPTIRTYAVKSLAGFSKENPSGGKNDSSGEDNAKKSDQPKKPSPATVTIKIEKEDFISAGKDEGKAEGKGGDPVVALSKWLPPNLLKGIASGHLSKELLEKVADLVPADALKKAVEYLQVSSKIQPMVVASTTEAKGSQLGSQLSGVSVVDVTSKAKADEEKSKMKVVVDSAKKAGKPMETPSRVQVIQPRKGLSNPAAVPSTTAAKGPITGSSAKTTVDVTGINKQPGSLTSAVKPPPPVQSCPAAAVPLKRKYDDIDLAKLKNLTFDEMLQLFQELLKDVLGSLFEEDQKTSAIGEKKILDSLSVKDREMALKVRQTTGITDLSRITHTMNVLKTLNAETIEALGQLDKSIIASSLSGNERAQKRGVTVLQQITELIMAKGTSDAKQVVGGGAQVPVGRGRGSVRPPQPGLSSGRGVQSLLTMNFADTSKVGALSAGTSATRPLLPTPHFPQRPRFSMSGGMMAAQGMGLQSMQPEQAHLLNFPQPRFLRKRGPPLQSDAFFGSGPPIKRWR